MSSVHARSAPIRLIHAIVTHSVGALRQPRKALAFAKSWTRFPLEYAAAQALDATPAVTFDQLFPEAVQEGVTPLVGSYARHSWNVRLDEEMFIGLVIRTLCARRIFEIGTFNGSTTRAMAEAAGPDARIWTLDLPEDEFNQTQSPEGLQGDAVGAEFRALPIAGQITQLLGDSTRFDFAPYLGSMDVVFVDAAHDYVHGIVDSRSALRLVRPGGVILWHDYVPGWPGLVHAIREATEGRPLKRLAGTSLAVLRVPEDPSE